jgi:hypothetical protein
MNRQKLLSLAAGLSIACTAPAPASVKPCRDANGRVIPCPKVRKAAPRCKDAKGQFTACTTPPDQKNGDISPTKG